MQRININNNNRCNKINTNDVMHNNNINKHQQCDAPTPTRRKPHINNAMDQH
jgi:hypothetical protein